LSLFRVYIRYPEETLTWGSVPPNIPHYETP